jgi:predicted peptidase
MYMRSVIKLLFFSLGFVLTQCSSEEDEVLESAPIAADSIISQLPDTVFTEVADTVVTEPAKQETQEQDSLISAFPDSAFYQAAKYSDMPYRIMFPRSYDSTKTYPLVIFLHGIDERGSDNVQQLKWGASLFQSDSVSHKYPSFVIFPQCPTSSYWHHPTVMQKLKGLIDDVVKTKSINADKIYIEGLSMGAYGTYAMVAKYSDLFAAAIAISGDGDVTKAAQMAKVDWKIYGGKKDTIVPGEKSEKMAEALRRSGASVSLKIYANATHVDTWVNAFAEPDYCSWIFSRSK